MKYEILIVDNDKKDADLLVAIFKHIAGVFQFIYAEHADHAFRLVKKHAFIIVFAKYHLPEVTGPGLLSAIRSQANLSDQAIFLYGENITAEESKMAKRLGAAGCIETGTNAENILMAITDILKRDQRPPYVFLHRGKNEPLHDNEG